MNSLLPEWDACRHVILGMLHVPALPGSSKYEGDPTLVEDVVSRDAQALCDGDVDGLVLEISVMLRSPRAVLTHRQLPG